MAAISEIDPHFVRRVIGRLRPIREPRRIHWFKCVGPFVHRSASIRVHWLSARRLCGWHRHASYGLRRTAELRSVRKRSIVPRHTRSGCPERQSGVDRGKRASHGVRAIRRPLQLRAAGDPLQVRCEGDQGGDGRDDDSGLPPARRGHAVSRRRDALRKRLDVRRVAHASNPGGPATPIKLGRSVRRTISIILTTNRLLGFQVDEFAHESGSRNKPNHNSGCAQEARPRFVGAPSESRLSGSGLMWPSGQPR